MIESKDTLEWCFTIASLHFGVFGFLYAIYVNINLQVAVARPSRPQELKVVINFCKMLALLIVVLTCTAAFISWQAAADWTVWVLVVTFAAVACFAVRLAWAMG
jgi:hypothetical protein